MIRIDWVRVAIESVLIAALVCFAVSRTHEPEPAVLGLASRCTGSVHLTRDFAVPVLMYHRIRNLTPQEAKSSRLRDLTVSPAMFERQMRYLVENGFSVLPLKYVEDAVRVHGSLPERSAAVTIDDGYRCSFRYAFPILRKYGLPATVFLVTSMAGAPDHVSWSELTAMQDWNLQCASHTVHHYDLTLLSREQLSVELGKARRQIDARLHGEVRSLAYPDGRCSAEVVVRVRAAGYRAGWTKSGGPVRPSHNVYLLPRMRVSGAATMSEFERIVWSGVRLMRREQGAGRAFGGTSAGSSNPGRA